MRCGQARSAGSQGQENDGDQRSLRGEMARPREIATPNAAAVESARRQRFRVAPSRSAGGDKAAVDGIPAGRPPGPAPRRGGPAGCAADRRPSKVSPDSSDRPAEDRRGLIVRQALEVTEHDRRAVLLGQRELPRAARDSHRVRQAIPGHRDARPSFPDARASRFSRRSRATRALRAVRQATSWSQGPSEPEGPVSIASARRASTRNVAWKASSAAWWSPSSNRRQVSRTIGPCRRTIASNARLERSRASANLREQLLVGRAGRRAFRIQALDVPMYRMADHASHDSPPLGIVAPFLHQEHARGDVVQYKRMTRTTQIPSAASGSALAVGLSSTVLRGSTSAHRTMPISAAPTKP